MSGTRTSSLEDVDVELSLRSTPDWIISMHLPVTQRDWFTYQGDRRQMRRQPSLQKQVSHVCIEFGIPVTANVSLLVDWAGHVFPVTNEAFNSLFLGHYCAPPQEFILSTSPAATATLTLATLTQDSRPDALPKSKSRSLSKLLRTTFFYVGKMVRKVQHAVVGRKPGRLGVMTDQTNDVVTSYIRSNRALLQQWVDNLESQTQETHTQQREHIRRRRSSPYPHHVKDDEEDMQLDEVDTIHTSSLSATSVHTPHFVTFDGELGSGSEISRFVYHVEVQTQEDEMGSVSRFEEEDSTVEKSETLSEFGMPHNLARPKR